MGVEVSKKDVAWGYFSQFFIMASGLITLPLILRMLSAEEIGLNYLMLTIGSLVSLFDFGFAPQFGRNITYVFSGATKLQKEGIALNDNSVAGQVNYRLLATIIGSAKFVYRRLSLIVLVSMLTLGSLYLYVANKEISSIDNSLLIWLIYSVSVYFSIYYSYYNALLTGRGLIMEAKKAGVYSRIVYVALTFVLLLCGLGLIGVVVANLVSPFVQRYLSHKYFFTHDISSQLNQHKVDRKERVEMIKTLWHNAKRSGLVFVGSYAVSKTGIFIAGFYLSLAEIGSYGLMMQLVGIIAAISGTLVSLYQPRFANLRVANDRPRLLAEFEFTMGCFYMLFIAGAALLVFAGGWGLALIGSNSQLPSMVIVGLYCLIVLLENNHANFGAFITTGNKVPFVTSSLISGAFIVGLTFISLEFLSGGLLAIVLAQGVVQAAYSNWKWPQVVCREFRVSFARFLGDSFRLVFQRIGALIDRRMV